METYLLPPDREPTKEQSTKGTNKVHLGEPIKFYWDYLQEQKSKCNAPCMSGS